MKYREFGSTGMKVSEVGFGAWAIGGKSYGAVDRREALRALARAEDLGCNVVDTAAVYGESEAVLGEFLAGRRRKWLVATKYSGQEQGLIPTVEAQLRRMKIDAIDFYQIHWAPREGERNLYEALYQLKRSGRIRFAGVSLYTAEDIDYVLDRTEIDGIQVAFSLLDPEPFLSRLQRIREKRIGVIVRSSLKGGFLAGKYGREAVFPDPNDQRSKWRRNEIAATARATERFRFLEEEAGSLMVAAARYPLSFPETSVLLLGTKSAEQAEVNFGKVPGAVLSDRQLASIRSIQKKIGFRTRFFFGILKRRLFGILKTVSPRKII